MITTLIALVMGHAVADFGLQSDWMAVNKNRNLNKTPTNWQYVMAAHGLIHGFMVAWITGNLALGLLEAICHCAIDFGKCENKYGIHADQLMHMLCKLLWAIL